MVLQGPKESTFCSLNNTKIIILRQFVRPRGAQGEARILPQALHSTISCHYFLPTGLQPLLMIKERVTILLLSASQLLRWQRQIRHGIMFAVIVIMGCPNSGASPCHFFLTQVWLLNAHKNGCGFVGMFREKFWIYL